MKYKLERSINCNIYKGHFYYKGQKVKVNVEKILENYRSHKCRFRTQKSYDYIESIKDKEFTIKWIEECPGVSNVPGVALEEFPHFLDVEDLISIKCNTVL